MRTVLTNEVPLALPTTLTDDDEELYEDSLDGSQADSQAGSGYGSQEDPGELMCS
jgi:hypothetical protein